VSTVLGTVRRAKTESKVSQRASVAALTVSGPAEWIAAVNAARADIVEALTVADFIAVEAAEVSIITELAPSTSPA
jgi:valyl-tRNA synthetase